MSNYPEQTMPMQSGLAGRLQMPSIRERLTDKKANLEASLAEVNKAIEMLNNNPAFEQVQDAIQKAGY